MDRFLKDIGGMYLITSLVIVTGGFLTRSRRNKPIEFEHLVTGLGYAGVMVWFIIGFALASWLVSIPFGLLFG